MSQITLLTGPERRRRWRDEEKLAVLEEAFAPGGCVSEVARRREISASLIYTWRRQAQAAVDRPAFVEAVAAGAGAIKSKPAEPVIRVQFATARVSITASASPALVGAVLRALR
jgi:transposase